MRSQTYLRERRSFWLFLLPPLFVYTLFWIVPLLLNFPVSLTSWNGVTPLLKIKFIGLANFERLFKDKIVGVSLLHNLIYMVITVATIPSIAFALALCIEKFTRAKGFFRTATFVPVVLPLLLVAMMFTYIYKLDNGLLNGFLKLVGLGALQRNWLGTKDTALIAVTIIPIWKSTPFTMTIILAGLQTVSRELEEASTIDGANFAQTTAYVTIPQMMPVLAVVVGLTIIDAFRMFDLIYMTTNGGPGYYTTEVISTYVFKSAFDNLRVGYATTLSIMNIFIVAVISAVYLRFAVRTNRD